MQDRDYIHVGPAVILLMLGIVVYIVLTVNSHARVRTESAATTSAIETIAEGQLFEEDF